MELPQRDKVDRYTGAGEYRALEASIRRNPAVRELAALFIYAFDFRTRVGPFLYIDKRLIPGAPQSVASALHAAGLQRLRVVLQQWNPNIQPSQSRIGGRRPDLLLISSMHIHSASACRLLADAYDLGEERPLILAGGAKAIYEPWGFFGLGSASQYNADVVVTGEEFVILQLLDRILAHKARSETVRHAFDRLRCEGLLEDIPGLVYRGDGAREGPPEFLVNTGIQRLVQDLDELPEPFEALGLFEPPHRRRTLSRRPVEAQQLGRYAQMLATVTTHGCKFRCSYCPIPAYNQFTFRFKSPDRMVSDMRGVVERTGIKLFFGTDDNFFNNRQTVEEIFSTMSRARIGRRPFGDAVLFCTEATEFDVFKNRDLLPLAREGGLRAIWFGVEDMTAELVKKGQSSEKTQVLFRELRKLGIAPMAMMMHHDGQPLWTRKSLYGLLNQVSFLRRAGACSVQITFLTPSVGTKGYEMPFRDGIVMRSVGNVPVEEFRHDGNHCTATADPHPWRRQLNVPLAYAAFYNPLNLLRALMKLDAVWPIRVAYQFLAMVGLGQSLWRTRDWFRRMFRGPVVRRAPVPESKIPVRGSRTQSARPRSSTPQFKPRHDNSTAAVLPAVHGTRSFP